jgi:hypothetical protein
MPGTLPSSTLPDSEPALARSRCRCAPRPGGGGAAMILGDDINLVLRMAPRIDPASRSGPRFIFKYCLCLSYIIFNGVCACIETARSHLRYFGAI